MPVGRPKIPNPKNKRLEIRLTENELKDLEYCANKLKTSKTAVINKGVQEIKKKLNM